MASITRTSEGRVSMNISEDVLEDFLRGLQALKGNSNNNWSQETKHRRGEVHNLRAELEHTQAKCDLLSAETNDLRSSTEKLCGTMKETLKQACESKRNLDQVRAENKALREKVDELDKVREENEILQSRLEAMTLELRLEKHLRATAENNAQMAAHSFSIQLFDKDTAEFEARSKAEQLEADLAFERTQTQTVQEKLNKLQKAFAQHREEAEKSAAQAQATYRAQREELTKIGLSLKKAENLLETKQVCIQEKNILLETASKTKEQYKSQLEEQKRERENVLAAFREDMKLLEQERVQWQEERLLSRPNQ
ncbi:hypothetical protein GBF38_009251 [Nibea albiflora]|uniref:Uncharacterized protein n=1 Tax=Nibea albiflora TaxID=240163 RepID=A0ACB7EQ30_NIBAL|nr:hypothetical protein GBF38_009251 [Nibea albiflora]